MTGWLRASSRLVGLRTARGMAHNCRSFTKAAGLKPFGLLTKVGTAGAFGLFLGTTATLEPTLHSKKVEESALKEEMVTIEVGNASELSEGQMKEVDVGVGGSDSKILIVKANGKIIAMGNKCSHAGAPLIDGVVAGGRIVCPWHNASFCLGSGKPLDAPALDAVPKYKVTVVDGKVFVEVPKSGVRIGDGPVLTHLQPQKVVGLSFSRRNLANDARTFVIIGGGAAAVTAAETLRTTGFEGRVLVVSREEVAPYDRTRLSKDAGVTAEKACLRNAKFWEDRDVEFLLGRDVVAVDANQHEIRFRDGGSLHYDCALVATGARPRFPNIGGSNLRNIFVLRDPSDSVQIGDACRTAKSAVVIGSSFIGMEVAGCLKKKHKIETVTVIGMESVPFERILGKVVGAAVMKRLVDTFGLNFRLQRSVIAFEGKNGQVSGVVLDNGHKVPCDLVVVGAGVVPETEFISGVRKGLDGGIETDAFLRAAKGLYVAGDIAAFPYWLSGDRVRLEHWNVAQQHGRIAARNMCGRAGTYQSVPYFWTVIGNIKMNYVGQCDSYDDIIYEGDVDNLKFIAYYIKDDRPVAAASIGLKNAHSAISEAMRTGRMPTGTELRSGNANLKTIFEDVATAGSCQVPNCPNK